MRKGILLITLLFVAGLCFAQSQKTILLLNIKDAIGPATQDFIERGLNQAIKQQNEAIILQLNTPGGLDKAMRNIIGAILAAPIPVITYVAPSGARAASAGTFILYASHIAAMAPGTNLGAASPVSIGFPGNGNEKKKMPSTLEKKAYQDAMAYIRSLAQLRGRNVQWGEQAVSQAVSLSATEALRLNVIDVVATDIPDLLNKINGRKITIQGQEKVLDTTGLSIQEYKPDWRIKFLAVITDPSVAYILLMIGVWGLFFEFANPGFVLPGVTGAICLLLALYAFQLLPINYVGLGLILLGIAFLIAEAFIASFGVLGVGGIIAFIIGSVLLLEKNTLGFQIAWQLILAVSIVTAAFFLLVINLALKSRFKPIVSGREELIDKEGIVISVDKKNKAQVRVLGEIWQAQSSSPLSPGQKVKIIKVEGLVLIVTPIEH